MCWFLPALFPCRTFLLLPSFFPPPFSSERQSLSFSSLALKPPGCSICTGSWRKIQLYTSFCLLDVSLHLFLRDQCLGFRAELSQAVQDGTDPVRFSSAAPVSEDKALFAAAGQKASSGAADWSCLSMGLWRQLFTESYFASYLYNLKVWKINLSLAFAKASYLLWSSEF